MPQPSSLQKAALWEATSTYKKQAEQGPAAVYLAKRGISPETATRFGLGYVGDPLPGHEMYRGMLSIPYLRWSSYTGWASVALRFRCFQEHEHQGHGKYNTMPGDRPRLFNTRALLVANDIISICEGELDAVTAQSIGIDAVAVPGATSWQSQFREPVLGYERVFILADGDEPGMRFAHTVATTLPNARILPCPPGEDVNSMVLAGRADELKERMEHGSNR